MSAIPSSTLPGHRRTHDRVCGALDLCQESPSVEFKESASWEELKVKIAATALGMGNLRDGGVIVVGVSERSGTWKLDGIGDDDLATFDEDELNDYVNRYASPSLRIELLLVPHQSQVFLAMRVPEFGRSPIVCKRNGPSGSPLREGAIFVRPPGKPQTTRVARAAELEELLHLAAEKRARELLESARRVGMELPAGDSDRFDEELGDL